MIHVEDKRLALSGGRTLAYADNGNTSSSILVLFLHGAFAVGDAARLSPVLLEKNVHFVAPSLPGWGRSSPAPASSSFATTLETDITALITHLHPQNNVKLYICSYAYGCVAAQMLYGAPYDRFSLGRQIAGVVLVAPHSPPHCHKDYAKCMSWLTYLMAGPPTRYIPFNLVPRLAKYAMANTLSSEVKAEVFVRNVLFDLMDEPERETFARWRDLHGVAEGQLEREMAGHFVRSVAQTWQGFLDIPAIYHSGWGGYHPDNLDEDQSRRPVFVVTSRGDDMIPMAMAEWLAANYKNARLKVFDGGHLSGLFHLDEIWKELLE